MQPNTQYLMSEALHKSSPRSIHQADTAVRRAGSFSLAALSQQSAEGRSFLPRQSTPERYHCDVVSLCAPSFRRVVAYLI